MSAPLVVLVSVILALKGRTWAANSNEIGAPIERGLNKLSLPNQNAQNKRHNARPVRKKRRKGKKKQRANCKNKPLQIKCINKKFSKRLKAMEGKMKKFANKGKVNKLEKSLSSRLNKMSENLTRNTNMISNSKVKLEEVVNSLAALQSNYSGAFIGTPGNITSSNSSAHNASILEELNATRYEIML